MHVSSLQSGSSTTSIQWYFFLKINTAQIELVKSKKLETPHLKSFYVQPDCDLQ